MATVNESMAHGANGFAPGASNGRRDFSKIHSAIAIPNLLDMQQESYERFLQMDLLPDERVEDGLEAVFKSVFPISDFREMSSLEFVSYSIGDWACKCGAQSGLKHLRTRCRQCREIIRTDPKGPPDILCDHCGKRTPNEVTFCEKCGDPVGLKLKYDPEECKRRGMTYAAPLKVNIRLTVFEKDGAGDRKSVRDIKEQEVFFGEIPLMTEEGTFIVTGTERVIVSQLHRSPGVFFESSADNTYYLGKIIPSRGSWIEFEYDAKKPAGQRLLNVRIDRKRKFLGTIFLRALGLENDADILGQFYRADTIRINDSGALQRDISESLVHTRLAAAVTGKSGKSLGRKGRKINTRLLQDMRAEGITALPCMPEDLAEAVFADDIFDEESGEVLHGCEANSRVTDDAMKRLRQGGLTEFRVIFPETDECGPVLSETLRKDSIKTKDQALLAIYRNLRPGDPPTRETATKLFNDMFFDPRKYDFSRVGRMKFNIKLHGEEEATPLDRRVLDASDFYETIRYLFKLRRKIGATDDIDHLGNRRVRSVGELLENQFRIGLIRMERAMRDRMTSYQDMSSAMPHDLINAKPVMAAVREFFGSSQLSQFMDQINPLSEITHKRRLSSLGPGGLSRERAGFDVRDVHPTHYGRICPIETAEGANIGLISSLSCFARINQYGFIESPYRKVENGRVVDEVRISYAGDTEFQPGQVVRREQAQQANDSLKRGREEAHWETHCDYLSAWEEDRHIIAQANIPVDADGNIGREFANCRVAGDTRLKKREEIQYLDVSPKQLVSVAASLIPFLENDDANRALMGSNMQRQAVPLLRAESPIVGTGMERITAEDSGAVVLCKRSGVVDSVDAERIIVRVEDTGHEEQLSREVGADIYPLIKFRRSNQNTCINQKPIVKIGDRVAKGQVLADGPCTDSGELALGRNVLVAFMPWRGYNFEDAILVSERLVKEDYYTSLHIEELKIEARDTKLGPEEITRDIPNISESFLKNLDESGIIRIGAKVGPDDILVGKVVPRGDVQLTPEEKLLRAIFGDKADDVKDASLRCPAGVSGVVVGAKVFSRRGVEKDARAKAIEEAEIERQRRNLEDEKRILYDQRVERLEELLGGNTVTADLHDERTNRKLASADDVLGRDHFERMRARDLKRLRLAEPVADLESRVDALEQMTIRQIEVLEKLSEKKIEKLCQGDELSPGVLKTVTISIAMKRKLSAGDKMAGRHGNKGVIARVMPEEDMPFLPDGTPVEIVLNPLGVPSRMNVGQILETHLGWAGQALGLKFAAPVFEGPSEGLIKEHLRNAGLPESGKTSLYDGLTGRAFEQEVTVGVIYMLKLNHLVDDKIHARSIGPYSLVTQQPLGGKAQFGGQRFGEMEVWALEAYGAAHILRELLTVKSDDVFGRAKIYESIVKGESAMNPGLPESFNVLVRELQALCLDVELLNKQHSSDSHQGLNLFDPSVAPAPPPAGDLNPAMGAFGAQNPFASAATQRVTAMPDFDAVRIGLASPEKIRGWSFGEVTKPETINYRTFKPERNGLFCTAIFGPEKDWECLCGKYKRMKHRGVICEKCGTEVTHSRVRRERLGHIELAAPCSHVWYFKVLPSHLSLLLDIKVSDLERVLYYEASVVVETGNPDALPAGTVLAGDELSNSRDEKERSFDFTPLAGRGRHQVLSRLSAGSEAFEVTVLMGAEAIRELLRGINTEALADKLREDMKVENSVQKRRKTAQRLRVVESFRKSGNKPEWMILQVLPIIPPELRPLVPLDGGRFATSDLNDLYRRVINRNNRLKRLLEQRAPDVIVRNEKRMLQEAVDALLDNGRRGHELRGANKRPLKSLANTLKGKSGRFRQNLLGKRVDYSGRSVIVIGPELKLHQCGLPKKMALELYKPFIYQRLEQRGHCTTIKQAKELVEQKDAIVWDILDGVIQDHPVLLNRAPTLHRLGIQAFEPVLVEGKAIKIHPLVCTAFNADFDGDQMGVHVPLSPEAQIEAHVLMLSANNILSPASGLPITTPSQDMVLGVYYLTGTQEGARGAGRSFGSVRDVLLAYDMDEVETRAPIKLHYSGAVIDLTLAGDSQDVRQTVPVLYQKQTLETTVGRVLLKDRLPKELPFVNGLLKKRGLSDLVRYCYQQLGREKTVEMLDELKEVGFLYATLSGMSIGIDDMVVPEQKEQLVGSSQKEVMKVEQQYLDGAITHGERYNKIIEIWSSLTDSVSREMFEGMRSSEGIRSSLNPIYAMADSGARGSETQIRQLSGMRGLMAKPSGEIIETPITANFREGLNVLQYFISTHGARKGLADTALKTANSGYLTRRLVDVAQDVIITENDCGTTDGITKGPLVENGEIRVPLSERIVGRVMAEDASDLEGNLIISAGEEVTDEVARAIETANINQEVKVRSVLTCETERGVCQLCYGQDLATGQMVEEGQAVGIIAAQSIGEPGTQLTMRTFHVGGTATRVGQDSRQTAKSDGFAKYVNVNPIRDKSGQLVAMSRNGFIAVVDSKGRERERYQVVYAARLRVEDGEEVVREQVLLEWDPFTRSILTESEGVCRFCDLQEGVTLQEQVDEVSGLSQWVVTDPEDGQRAGEPRVEIHDGQGKLLKRYLIPTTAHLMVKDDEPVSAGDELAKIPLATTKNKDITGGLPRVVELFEARRPKSPEPAIISEIDGTVNYGSLSRGYRRITVVGAGGEEKEYKIPRGSHINVQEGEIVKAGEPLMEGPHDPQDILRILGEADLQSYLVNEIQDVYRLQGVDINDKHLEVIVRQMMRWVKIESVGDTEFLVDEVVDKFRFRRINREVEASGGTPATSQPLLMGIRKAAVSTDSFISAASFETTTKVLTEASVAGRVDDLRGLKENVIVGRLIPAGTGLDAHQRVRIAGEDEPEKLVPEMEYLTDIPGYSDDAAQLFEGELPLGFGEDFGLEGVKLPQSASPEAGEAELSAPSDPVVPD